MIPQKKKNNFQIVVSRYNEDISWTYKYQPNVIIYNKGKDHISGSIRIPNVGRESHTYLYHIIQNYDSLPERIVFVQGRCPSFGYEHPSKGGHLYSNYYFDDYIRSQQDIELIITSCVTRDLHYLHVRKGYDKYQNIRRPISRMPTNTKIDHWLPATNFTNFRDYLNNLKKSQKGTHTLESFWKKYVSKDHQLPTYLYYNQGAQFSVSREVILQHSLQYYQQLITELEKDINPYQGYFMEWVWPYILTKKKSTSKKKDESYN